MWFLFSKFRCRHLHTENRHTCTIHVHLLSNYFHDFLSHLWLLEKIFTNNYLISHKEQVRSDKIFWSLTTIICIQQISIKKCFINFPDLSRPANKNSSIFPQVFGNHVRKRTAFFKTPFMINSVVPISNHPLYFIVKIFFMVLLFFFTELLLGSPIPVMIVIKL